MRIARLIAATALVTAPLLSAAAQATVDTGSVAPNFTAPGANMSGVIPSVSLAAYKGKTVVLAFFYKARTKG
jgi:hypothetical protein